MGKNPLEVPPHVYAIAENAFHKMTSYKESQCVIISGESGAGKTEAAKKIMHYIAEVSGGQGNSSIQQVKDMVMATNPLLESFGCAKTLRNNNSSRHGKYLEILFNVTGEPVGAKITNYLLEKGRVVGQIKDERNFHIFYQLTKATSQEYRDRFGLVGPDGYNYTMQAGCLDVPGIDDAADYESTLDAMRVIGLSKGELDDIHRVLAVILWLGNVVFQEADNDACTIGDVDVTDFAAGLMQVEGATLHKALTSRTIETIRGGRRGSVYESPLNPTQATATRDALCKALYDRLFEWIVSRVNAAMVEREAWSFVIGVLDIYGFEIFDHNSFEQLCINYVNEKLQQIFIELTLKAEQEEYVQEQIKWTPIDYFNNKIVCDLIEEKRPPGVFAAMNDACATAHADSSAADSSFVQRLAACSSNRHFDLRGQAFLIKHYAGDVMYEIPGMTDKNKDQLVRDLLDLVDSSSNAFLCSLFPERVDRDSKKRPPTASDRIKGSAGELVTKLKQAQPSYIRCIKPNANKSATEFDDDMVMHQVKYLGLNENVRIRRAGFAFRQTFEKFIERFYLLSSKTSYAGEYIWDGDAKSGTQRILADSGIPTEEWQIGVTKCFIRHPETIWALEHLRDRYWHNMAMRIQRAWRNYMEYKHECARRIQGAWKRNKDQIRYVQLRDYGHQMLAGRKERRRFSLVSQRRYYGDYLGVSATDGDGAALKDICNIGANERVAFSARCQLLVPRPLRSSKPSPRILILTNTWLYLVVAAVEKKLVTLKVERKVSLTSIKAVSASTLQDDWIVVHVNDPQNVDLVLITSFKTELCAHMVQQTGGSFNVQVASEFDYIKKPGKTATLKFVKDEKATGDGEYKSHTISICTGAPATSVSDPPCAKKHVPVRPVAAGKLLKKGGPSKTPMKRPVARPFPTATHVPMNAPAARKVETVSSSVSVATKMATPPSLTKKPPTATKPTPTPVSVQPVVAPVPVKIPSPVQPVVVKKAEVVKPVEVEKKATAPRPPPARQPPPPVQRPASPRYETLYDFEPEDDGEIAFSTGDVLKILEKDDNGWWLARKVNGDEGWVPANYVREIKVAVKSPPPLPNKKPSRKVPTPSASVEVERQPESLHVKPLAHERSASPAVEEPEEEEVPKKKPSLLTKPTTYTYQEPADDAPRPMFPTQSSDASIPLWKQELMARKKAKEGPAGASTVSYKTTVAQEEEEGAATMGAGGVARLAAAFSQNPGGMGFGKWQKPKRDPSPPPEADDDWDD